MTKEHFEHQKFRADCKYAREERIVIRRIKQKYRQRRSLGFHSDYGRAVHICQLEIAEAEELKRTLEELRGDIEAEFFGTRGMKEIAKMVQSSTPVILLPLFPRSITAISSSLNNNSEE